MASMLAQPMIVAHRGASADAPENTIPAFELAWKQGADAVEGDFRLTSDGHIVCVHDRKTKKADQILFVKDSTLEQLRKLDVGIKKGEQWKGTKIPTLAEVLATVPDNKKIYIEVKCGPEIIPRLLDEIKKSKLKTEQVIIIAFDAEVIKTLKDTAPRFKAFWLAEFREDEAGKIKPSIETVLKTLKNIKADGLSSSYKNITESMIKQIQAEGYEYHVWTIDDPETAGQFVKWGAFSITTNTPKKLIGICF